MRRGRQVNSIPGMSFWQKLDEDIDQIGNRAKDKWMRFEQHRGGGRQNPQTKNINKPLVKLNIKKSASQRIANDSFEQIPILDRRQLEKMQKDEGQKQTMLKNRLGFLEINKERQNKTIQLAKRKYQHVSSIRAQTIRQKEVLRKKIKFIETQDKSQKNLLVDYVKSARQKRNMSLAQWKSTIQQNAQSIKNQTMSNESFAALEKERIKELNTDRANQAKKNIERSRSIITQIRQKQVTDTRGDRKKQLLNRIKSLNDQKKLNQQILCHLQSETKKVNQWKSRAQKQIQEYQSYLGLTQRSLKNTSRESEKSLRSFYVTHF